MASVSLSRTLCRRCTRHFMSGVLNAAYPVNSITPRQPSRFSSLSPSLALSPEPINNPSAAASPWRIVVSVCVQRMPTIVQEKTELELKYEKLKDQVRMERSKLSDFELEELEFEAMKKARIKKALEEESHLKNVNEDETDEFEDLQESRELELQEFEPSPRLTEADKANDMRSLERKLDRVLYLLVRKPRKDHKWQMPQGGVEEKESLLEAAKREFTEECGSSANLNFYSHAPSAVFSYKHPPLQHSSPDLLGSKVFFMKAFYQSGLIELDGKELVDHIWVTKEEMKDYVSPDYYQAVIPILMD